MNIQNANELGRAKRRIRQLENCLQDVAHLLFARGVDLNAAGRDDPEDAEYRTLRRINNRVNRTLRRG